MSITATELKKNLGAYLTLAEKEDVEITKNGRVVAIISSPYKSRRAIAESLFGILPDDISEEEAKQERLSRK